MKENEELKEAKEKLETLSEDEETRYWAELRQKAVRDKKATYDAGVEEGIEKGSKEEKRRIAKNLLRSDLTVEVISAMTGLTTEEVEELKEAKEKLETLSEEEETRYWAELRQKAVRDKKATYDAGVEEGIEKGIEKGSKEEKRRIAKKLLKSGMKAESILEITELTKEEIERLKE